MEVRWMEFLTFALAAPKTLPGVPIEVPLWAWGATLVVILLALLADLFVFNRDAHEISMREATWAFIGWVALGVAFGAVLLAAYGMPTATEYFAGYLIEKSLSVDNIFVFALVFSYFAVPKIYQHRLLFWGIFGALIFRAIFIAAGAAILDRFSFATFFFGAFLVLTGIKLARQHEMHDVGANPMLKWMRKHVSMTDTYDGQHFWVKRGGKRFATPMLAVLLVIETTDIVFAVDSIPAIFAVTSVPFIVFTSNAFAILGLRAAYFLLAGAIDKFTHLRFGLAAVLAFVGVKMIVVHWYHLPTWISLLVIAAIISLSIFTSLRAAAKREAAQAEQDAQAALAARSSGAPEPRETRTD